MGEDVEIAADLKKRRFRGATSMSSLASGS